MELNLVEIFGSAQGEGPYVGCSTLFVRLGGCDLRCNWCDSPGTWRPPRSWRLEVPMGSGRFETSDNPATCDDVMKAVERLDADRLRFISVTGGEPLLQDAAVRELAERVRPLAPRLLLETHGLAVEALARVRDVVDVVSMDWKLARDVRWEDATKPSDFVSLHEEFLAIADAGGEVYVKLVVTAETLPEDVAFVAERVAAIAPSVPLILQPVTPFGRVKTQPSPGQLLALLRACEERLADVRLIPQTHRVYGAL